MQIRRWARAAPALALALAFLGWACGAEPEAPPAQPAAAAPAVATEDASTWVGGETCAECHAEAAARWRGSHHDLAMQVADERTVLGDFDGAQLTHFGVTTTFRREGGAFVVTTDGPDGALRDYQVAYTFGAEPLQQYLIRFPGGRLQALGVVWDTRPAKAGGQRWYHLHPDEAVPAGDALHWTGPNQNWNSMCAECHSTGLVKGYDPDADAYETASRELDVSCEACHGPGSAHVAWARAGAEAGTDPALVVDLRNDGDDGDDGNDGEWILDDGAAIARRSAPRVDHTEIETCAPCHARRTPLRDEAAQPRAFLDAYRPALLDATLYHPDGQIQDEVYVWGSFLQSRMYAAGVTCSDCHDPHALAIEEPDEVCAGCHRSEVFASATHHHHPPGSSGASCVACHMPTQRYMGIDARGDHSFRVPRPDLSQTLGSPNACKGCHADRSLAWSRAAAARWWPGGRNTERHWGEAIAAGRARGPEAASQLAALVSDATAPAIARATALRLLREQASPPPAGLVRQALRDPDPLLRLSALEASESLPPPEQLALARPLLEDPMLAVRVQAASSLARVPPALWPPGSRGAFAQAVSEHRAAQRASAERPEARLNTAALHAQFGELDAARQELETALRLAPWFVPAYVNLADVHRAQGREAEAERALRRAVALLPDNADTRHALGLALVRQGRLDEAVVELARAAELAPRVPRYTYAHGVAMWETGHLERAREILEAGHRRHPQSAELLLGLATLARDTGDRAAARGYAQALAARMPDDPNIRQLLAELEEEASP